MEKEECSKTCKFAFFFPDYSWVLDDGFCNFDTNTAPIMQPKDGSETRTIKMLFSKNAFSSFYERFNSD